MLAIIGFGISTSGSALYLFLILLFAAFSYYVYKHTIPNIPGRLKIILISLRSLIFFLLLFILLDPLITIVKEQTIISKTFVFIDNSNSIAVKDSIKRLSETANLVKAINSDGNIKANNYLFGREIDSLYIGDINKIDFTQSQTNFANIINDIKNKSASVNSVVIISDGIINDGIDPAYQAEKLQMPLFTIGIGDSTQKKDAEINNVLSNQFIYVGKSSAIEIGIKNFGLGNVPARLLLFEDNKLLDSKDVILSESGLNKVSFNYKPLTGGEKKLKAVLSSIPGEYTTANNSRTFYLNILDTKLKVCIISGSPTADVSAIVKALSTDKNIEVKKIIQTAPNKFLNDEKVSAVDSADILFLIDFPSSSTLQSLFEKVSSVVKQNKPFFFLLTTNVDINRLSNLNDALPFSIVRAGSDYLQVQPELISEAFSSYFSSSNNKTEIWNNLPPTNQLTAEFLSKPGSNILMRTKIRNVSTANPLIVVRSIGKQRSFSILCADIWRWQLQTAEKYPEFFDNFVNDIVKWLSVSTKQKQFIVSTDKKTFFPGEPIQFKAELYDNTFTPIDTSKIQLHLTINSKTTELSFSPAGNGIYTSGFIPSEAGDYNFKGLAHLDGKSLNSDPGRFTVEEAQIEKIDTRMRVDYLKLLARSTGGEYFPIDNSSMLIQKLRDINRHSLKIITARNEFQLFSQWWMLAVVVMLFSCEWFIRKRAGMI